MDKDVLKCISNIVSEPLDCFDSIRNLKNNIKAISYLENMSGILHGMLRKNEEYLNFKKDVFRFVKNKDDYKLIRLHRDMSNRITDKKELGMCSTMFVVLMYEANKELGLYD